MVEPPRQRIYSGGPWEVQVGYARAVRVGANIFVSGSTAMKDGKVVGAGDPAVQTEQALETISAALVEAGSSLADVVRYRIYAIDVSSWQAIAPVLASYFGNVHPAGTLVGVVALIHPELLVEIEVDAIIGSAAPLAI